MSDNLPASAGTIDCPQCGRTNRRDPAQPFCVACGGSLEPGARRVPVRAEELRPAPAGGGKRVLAYLLLAFAALMLLALAVVPALVALPVIALSGGGGALLLRGAKADDERAEAAWIERLQPRVLALAREQPRLTVGEVSSRLGWPMPLAERVLDSMDDGLRLYMMPNDEGIMVYEFREGLDAPPERPLLG